MPTEDVEESEEGNYRTHANDDASKHEIHESLQIVRER